MPALIPEDATFDTLVARQPDGGDGGDQKGLPGRDFLYPQYSIHNKAAFQDDWSADKGGLSNKTVNTDVITQNGLASYDVHNLYGAMMSIASYDAMLNRRPGKRPLIITRSTFSGTGHKVGHWLGDNLSTWEHYRISIRTMVAYASMFQFPMVGSDVCGFGGNTTEELCARWASLGAFNTFYRNHNELGAPGQEFYLWETVAESARKAIAIRYRLLDYMYTAMSSASADGSPVLSPMFYMYPEDKETWALENQFFYGPGLLVAPVLAEGATSVDAYLPDDLFYDWYTHEPIRGRAALHTFSDVDTTHIPLLIRSGVILPARESSANTTKELRTRDFEILVPLAEDGTASGELFFDDGESLDSDTSRITLEYTKHGKLVIDGDFGFEVPVAISKVTLLGGAGCKAGQCEDGMFSRSKKVHISLNKKGSYRVEDRP